MQDDDVDDAKLDLPDHLRPIDQLLRSCSNASPKPPDGLCHNTLERCFSRIANAPNQALPTPFMTQRRTEI